MVLLAAVSLTGALAATAGGILTGRLLLLDGAIALLLAAAILSGIAFQRRRSASGTGTEAAPPVPCDAPARPSEAAAVEPAPESAGLRKLLRRLVEGASTLRGDGSPRRGIGLGGLVAVVVTLFVSFPAGRMTTGAAIVGAALCLLAVGLSATTARYFARIGTDRLAEATVLAQGARVTAWIFVLAALSMAAAWAGRQTLERGLHYAALLVDSAVVFQVLTARSADAGRRTTVPARLGVLLLLGGRANVVASVLDAVQRQLGIDVRSTWALTVVRRSLEPLLIGLLLVGWLSTSVDVVRVDELGLVERFGALVADPPLEPGIHLHWPWPIDRVERIPARVVQSLTVGHEGEEEGGPEDVLWAVRHAANEYTLLLGNGRDLITVDAAVQYRIRDVRAWQYSWKNPADALRAVAYRAVMRSTVNRTLDEALSENLETLAASMREMVQHDADQLGLGVEVVAFTVGGLHPPVPVSASYQEVASAQLFKVTAVVSANAYRTGTVAAAETEVDRRLQAARADAATQLARAAGEAWGFRALASQYRATPGEFFFRRRLEALEQGLKGRQFTIVDRRIQRDGGQLWLIP